MQQTYVIQDRKVQKDGLGGQIEAWSDFLTVRGYLDLQSGTDRQSGQNAIVEGSTHVLIIPKHIPAITADHRVKDPESGRIYAITYADDPVGIHHHTELYLQYQDGEQDG